jgi:hypothetical protein
METSNLNRNVNGPAKHRRFGPNWAKALCILLSFSALTALAGSRTSPPANYASPFEFSILKRQSNVKVVRRSDHDEIFYALPKGHVVDQVMESRWEDGSSFMLFSGKKQLIFLREDYGIWGYSTLHGLQIFFVDYNFADVPDFPKSEENKYDFDLVDTDRGRLRVSQCVFDISQVIDPGPRAKAWARHAEDPVPRQIARLLARRGVDRASAACKPRDEPAS